MSGRGEGRGRGGGRRGGRGPPPQSRGGGGVGVGVGGDMGRGRGRESYASPSSSSQPSLSEETEKLSLADVEVPVAAPPQPSPPVSTKAIKNPPRPGFGRVGDKTMLRANHFLVTVADRDLHHYDVSISPEVISKKVCREIINELVKSYRDSHLGKRSLAYDGRKSCYTAGALPFSLKDFVVKLADDGGRREREFKVSIKFAARADLQHLQEFLRGRQLDVPQETIQALDVVLRQRPSNIYQVVGRSFFNPKLGEPGPLADGLEYWKGFYQSLRPTQMGLSLNIDTSARAFYEPLLVADYICHYLRKDVRNPLSDMDRLKVRKVLKGVRVEVTHGGCKRYKITGLSTEQSRHLMFSMGESETAISVDQYFLQKYNIRIQYGFLPCIKAGSDAKPIYLPMEVCRIVEGQRYTRKLNEKQVSALLTATCQRPPERERSIKAMVNHNNYNGDPFVTEFGIQVKPELTAIEARVLPSPTLMYHATGREKMVQPRNGSWNMIDKRMVTGAKVRAWACVCFSDMGKNQIERFCRELVGMCSSKGMEFNPDSVIEHRTPRQGENIESCLVNLHRECEERLKAFGPLQLLIIVLPTASGSYGRIKRICETELGIVSQCCQPSQAMRCNKQYLENVALKINVKVGGQNTVLEVARNRRVPLLSDLPTIIIGADVTHPSPGEDMSPSIAAVVASVDWPDVTTYRAIVSAQAHREEMIQDLYKTHQDPKRGTVHSGMIREHLMAFYKKTRNKPSRMIFYRDGVSEGQFSQVLLYEMDAIRRACMSIEEGYLPRVTFVVVQKRHHTRLFPGKPSDGDKAGNILPGTVVDSKICHPTDFDFYLCSHAGIKGTSRPTHYHVLYDENGFSADGLQLLTNNLCYTYARCTRSVSIVPPAYYAHLAAFRARYYMEGVDGSDGASTAGEGGPGPAAGGPPRRVRPLPVIMDNVKEVMFYC